MYVHFDYAPDFRFTPISEKEHVALSSDKSLEIVPLKYGLNFELNITGGRIDFLELVSNGEEWDGNVSEYRLTE